MTTSNVESPRRGDRMATGVTWMVCGAIVHVLVLFLGNDPSLAATAVIVLLIGTTNNEGGPVPVRLAVRYSFWNAVAFIAAAHLSRALGFTAP